MVRATSAASWDQCVWFTTNWALVDELLGWALAAPIREECPEKLVPPADRTSLARYRRPMVNAVRLKISLVSIGPAPWRVVDVPVSMNLTGLHRTIQGAFLWHDSHLWHFEVAEKSYGPLWVGAVHDGFYNPDNKRLSFLTKLVGQDFRYVYDMGDWWEHQIEILEFMNAPSGTRLPIFIEGAGRTPPENVGGPPGFTHFLESLADPGHPDHAHMLNWYGKPFQPDDIDETIVHIMLKREAAMRPPVK